MFHGSVVQIFISPEKGELTDSITQANIEAGFGITGDRYENTRSRHSIKKGYPNSVTFIEVETFEAIARDYKTPLDPSECRRNIVTRGVPLNHLIGKKFWVGDIEFRGFELAEPCAYLEKILDKPVIKLLRHRGGLRAEALNSGDISIGTKIRLSAHKDKVGLHPNNL